MAPPATLRILVVDDNPIVRDSVTAAVKKLNAQTQTVNLHLLEAADGATAWDRLQAERFALVIVDLYLPVLNGLQLIQRIRDRPEISSTPILAISASLRDARERSLGAGADQFLQKPVRLLELTDALRHLLRLDAT